MTVTPSLDDLYDIANRMQPYQDALGRAWARYFSAGRDAQAEYGRLLQTVREVNDNLGTFVLEIARVTNSSVASLNAFRPDPIRGELAVWFDDNRPADFIRCVARYRSFNQKAWISQGWRSYSAEAKKREAIAA